MVIRRFSDNNHEALSSNKVSLVPLLTCAFWLCPCNIEYFCEFLETYVVCYVHVCVRFTRAGMMHWVQWHRNMQTSARGTTMMRGQCRHETWACSMPMSARTCSSVRPNSIWHFREPWHLGWVRKSTTTALPTSASQTNSAAITNRYECARACVCGEGGGGVSDRIE